MAHSTPETEEQHQQARVARESAADRRQQRQKTVSAWIYHQRRTKLLDVLPNLLSIARADAEHNYKKGYGIYGEASLPISAPRLGQKREDSLNPIVITSPIANFFEHELERQSVEGWRYGVRYGFELFGRRRIVAIWASTRQGS